MLNFNVQASPRKPTLVGQMTGRGEPVSDYAHWRLAISRISKIRIPNLNLKAKNSPKPKNGRSASVEPLRQTTLQH